MQMQSQGTFLLWHNCSAKEHFKDSTVYPFRHNFILWGSGSPPFMVRIIVSVYCFPDYGDQRQTFYYEDWKYFSTETKGKDKKKNIQIQSTKTTETFKERHKKLEVKLKEKK